MAFTRYNYDEYQTKIKLQQSTDIGNYHLNVPGNGIQPYFIEDPNIRIQKWGGNIWTNVIDLESNLKGIDKQKKCDSLRNKVPLPSSAPIQYPTTRKLYVEHSRYINPAWNLKGIEQDKSEYLYYNPQIKAFTPFHTNVSSRIMEKDLYNPIYGNNFGNF